MNTLPRILIVDDEQTILDTSLRTLHNFDVTTALGPEIGLQLVEDSGPFAVVVSDYKMPYMNGIDFLAKVKEASPDTVLIIMTGFADVQLAIDVLNKGLLFRIITKPCSTDIFVKSVNDGLEQFRLIQSEHDLFMKPSINALVWKIFSKEPTRGLGSGTYKQAKPFSMKGGLK